MKDPAGTTLPPRQTCPGCGRAHRSYKPECGPCRALMRENAAEGARLAREQREGRRQETLDAVEERRPVPYNEFPPGYGEE